MRLDLHSPITTIRVFEGLFYMPVCSTILYRIFDSQNGFYNYLPLPWPSQSVECEKLCESLLEEDNVFI